MAAFEVMFYEKENGYCPVEEFITSLDLMLMCDKVTPQYDRQPPLLFRTKGHSIRRVHDFMLYLKY